MRASIRPVVATLISVGAVVAANTAHADVVTTPCAANELTCSRGTASLKAESRETILSSIQTGWWPQCTSENPDGTCNDDGIKVKASVDLAAYPAPSTEPLWMVDMSKGAIVDVRWPTTEAFEITTPNATTNEGIFKISHTLIPQVHISAGVFGLKANFTFSAGQFVEQFATNFKYRATNSVAFAPWAFDPPVVNLVPAPANGKELFATDIVDTDTWNVNLALTADTEPTFTYRTTSVTLAGGTPITTGAEKGTLPMVDADYLELPATVVGELLVEGTLDLEAVGTILHKGMNLNANINQLIYGTPYQNSMPVKVEFPPTTVRVPLPNVKAPATVVDLGQVQIGNPADKVVTITNTGELSASLAFTSDNALFTPVATAVAAAQNDYPLVITFAPTEEGLQTATITMTSNDPDSPTQTFQVQAFGTLHAPDDDGEGGKRPGGGPDDDDDLDGVGDSGCGCRTAPAPSSYGALGGLGLMALFFVRRRRSRA